MYQYLDQSLATLEDGARFLVRAMRHWVAAAGGRRCAASHVAPAFAKCGIIDGLVPFLRMMALVNRHGLETFGFAPIQCDRVTEHEALMLSLIGSVDDGGDGMIETLKLMLAEEGHGEMIEALTGLHRIMSAAEIRLG